MWTLIVKSLSYKVPDDFEPLGLINEAPSVLIGNRSLSANSFDDLRKWMVAKGGEVSLANAGVGSASHLCGLMIQSALKVKFTAVPYKGTAPAMNDLIGGQVDLMCEQATNAVPQIEGNKIRPFAQTGLHRLTLPTLKNTPTLSEAGVPSFNVQVWHGLYAPKGTPPHVLLKLNTALRVALKDPELIRRQEALGLMIVTDGRLDPGGHRKFVETEVQRWGKVIRESGEYAD